MNERNPEIDPMLYPLLFPYSEAGIHKYKLNKINENNNYLKNKRLQSDP